MKNRGEVDPHSSLHYVLAGVVVGVVAFFVGESLRTEPRELAGVRRLQTAIAFATAGGVAAAVHRRLRALGSDSVAGHYLRWVATATSGAAVLGLNEFLVEQTLAALTPIVFFGLAGGVGLGVLDRYVRQALL